MRCGSIQPTSSNALPTSLAVAGSVRGTVRGGGGGQEGGVGGGGGGGCEGVHTAAGAVGEDG